MTRLVPTLAKAAQSLIDFLDDPDGPGSIGYAEVNDLRAALRYDRDLSARRHRRALWWPEREVQTPVTPVPARGNRS